MLLWGDLPAPEALALPGGQRRALLDLAAWRAAVSLVSGRLCGLLGQPGGTTPPPASQSPAVSSQQGCQPRAGERRPWEPGAADLSPPLSTARFSSHTLCVWPGHRLVSLSPVRPSLATVALSLWWPGPPSLSWAHAHGLTWGNAGSTSLRVDFIEAEAGCANPGSAWIWDVRPR